MTRRAALVCALLLAAAPSAEAACKPPQASAADTARVAGALRSGVVVSVAGAPSGPTPVPE